MRHYMPCRECNAVHTNPMSSNLCGDCGVLATKNRIAAEAAIEDLFNEIFEEEIPVGEDTRPKDRVKQGISPSTVIEEWDCTQSINIMSDKELEQFYWDNPEAIPDKE